MAPEVAAKMAKLLRMLTSSHDGEILAAANRINVIAAFNSVNWEEELPGVRSPSQEEMQQVYSAGYERGLADGVKSAQPTNGRHDDWLNAGVSARKKSGCITGTSSKSATPSHSSAGARLKSNSAPTSHRSSTVGDVKRSCQKSSGAYSTGFGNVSWLKGGFRHERRP